MDEFEFYREYFGGAEFESEDEFEPFCDRAKRYIEQIACTQPDFSDEDILACVCALAEIYARCTVCDECEEIDGYGRSEDELLHTARLYLPSALMYRGF